MSPDYSTVTGTVEKPARVEQADRVVTAPHLDLDREHEAIAAVGPGSLRIVRAGADAPDTGSQIHWQERMDFKAEEKVALFRGGVTARFAGADLRISSGRPDDHLAGRAGVRDLQHIDLDSALMQVTFADVPDTRPTRPGRTDLTVRELVARGNVRVKAVSSDVIRRFEGQRVTFTAADKSTGQTADSLIVIEGGDRGAGPSLTPDLARFWSEGGAGSEASFQERLVSQRILFYPDRGEVVTEDTRLIEVMPRGDTSTAEPTEKPKPVSSRLIWSRG